MPQSGTFVMISKFILSIENDPREIPATYLTQQLHKYCWKCSLPIQMQG
jgi:hypothetical protein